MLVVSLCKHYDKQLREEGEEFEHLGPLYEHIVPVEVEMEAPQKGEPLSRQQKPARSR